jgi:predicted  nucleic acid-binding Zn-ribbon protein
VHADLEALFRLQEHDQAVMAIEVELTALEPEIAALDGELAQAEAELKAAQRGVEEAGTRRVELEGRIESYRVMQERRRQRLEWVRGAKEASTLMAELDLARTVLAKEEAEWIRSADKVQEAERRLAEVESKVEQVRTAQAPRREAIAAIQADCGDRLAAARRAREAAAKTVRPALLGQYERIRRGRGRLALYPLHGEACGHCYTAVPMHRRRSIQEGQAIVTCEACGVMIYYPNS